mmetsp:Transcript_13119/g.35718  ORF Transcript_13119/g.35718 Transcript_13119/m.35718 type:complete len:215 (+) Transcript_13119:68-712(+)
MAHKYPGLHTESQMVQCFMEVTLLKSKKFSCLGFMCSLLTYGDALRFRKPLLPPQQKQQRQEGSAQKWLGLWANQLTCEAKEVIPPCDTFRCHAADHIILLTCISRDHKVMMMGQCWETGVAAQTVKGPHSFFNGGNWVEGSLACIGRHRCKRDVLVGNNCRSSSGWAAVLYRALTLPLSLHLNLPLLSLFSPLPRFPFLRRTQGHCLGAPSFL